MVGWHHRLNGYGFGWTLGVGDGQGGLLCCSSWGHKVGHNCVTKLNIANNLNWIILCLRELSCTLSGVQHPWPLPTKSISITLPVVPRQVKTSQVENHWIEQILFQTYLSVTTSFEILAKSPKSEPSSLSANQQIEIIPQTLFSSGSLLLAYTSMPLK